MTRNVLQVGAEIYAVLGGIVVMVLAALALSLPVRPRTWPGSSGHRKEEEQEHTESVRPDGYIDSFANQIEEAGGDWPGRLKLAIPIILLWWLIYLILNWTPR